jgi:diguanylate cyclase (GGDEF)-like protein
MAPTGEADSQSGIASVGLEPEAPTRDFVGWTSQPEFRHARRLSVEVTRKVLATALGVSADALAGLDSAVLRTALDRMRAMAAYTQKLAETAATDDLTGASRRGAGLTALQREIDRARRAGGNGIVVIFLDVDGLKQVNDTHGHAAGDRLLVDVVAAIRKRVRSYDLVMRYGGDEFVCALVDVAAPDAARTLADIRHHYELRTHGHTISAGTTTVIENDTAESAVARADADLYSQRRKGDQ